MTKELKFALSQPKCKILNFVMLCLCVWCVLHFFSLTGMIILKGDGHIEGIFQTSKLKNFCDSFVFESQDMLKMKRHILKMLHFVHCGGYLAWYLLSALDNCFWTFFHHLRFICLNQYITVSITEYFEGILYPSFDSAAVQGCSRDEYTLSLSL